MGSSANSASVKASTLERVRFASSRISASMYQKVLLALLTAGITLLVGMVLSWLLL